MFQIIHKEQRIAPDGSVEVLLVGSPGQSTQHLTVCSNSDSVLYFDSHGGNGGAGGNGGTGGIYWFFVFASL
jgi:hypothetical protein